MDELIRNLLEELGKISVDYVVYQKKNNVSRVEELMPQVQEFILWFLNGNQFGIEDEEYQILSNNLLDILKDIMEAIKEKDYVLMHDAITYGLMEYLQMFVAVEEDNAYDNL